MKNERLQVLKMVEDGKITVDEATKLLESLKGTGDFTDYSYNFDFEERFSQFSQNMNNFAKDVSERLNEAFKDVQPKVREVTKTVVSKTADIADNISKSLNETIKNYEDCNNQECCGNGVKPEATCDKSEEPKNEEQSNEN